MMCNNLASQSCSTAAPPFFFFAFYVFTVIDKAPAGSTIMLCRCSQQERVIAVGVWSSLRRFGSSGQSCQKLPKDPPGYTRVLLPCSENLRLSFHFACDANSTFTACTFVQLFIGVWNALLPVNQQMHQAAPGTCQCHTCPQDSAAL